MVSGVPQDTVLGPLLFLLHINDLPSVVSSKVKLFAEDSLIYRNIKNKQDQLTLQKDLRLRAAKHIATMTNKANSKLSFLRRNFLGCQEKLKQTAHSFMEYDAIDWDPYQKYNSDKVEMVQSRAARFVKSRYSRYSSVSDMLDELKWPPLSQRAQEARLIMFYKIINGLAQVPFEGVLIEAYKGTRRKHNMKFRQIGNITSQYGQSFPPTPISACNGISFVEAPSLAVFRSNFL